MDITFLLNGETISIKDVSPTETFLDWLRDSRKLTGTKEGCNEGDCGACTVIVIEKNSVNALNSCILFLPQIDGKAIRTIEGISLETGMHPIQSELISSHGSQCGFCTPGFVISLVVAQINNHTNYDEVLAGNLCRCTGYEAIIRATANIPKMKKPEWIKNDQHILEKFPRKRLTRQNPQTSCDLLKSMMEAPEATLVAGATDVGLWVTKELRELSPLIFLNSVDELKQIEEHKDFYKIGALVTIEQLEKWTKSIFPSYSSLLNRFASKQIRSVATIGGNIVNGSPIGDNAPVLLTLDAICILRSKNGQRRVPLNEFYIEYGKQNIINGEFLESIIIKKKDDSLRCYKISKRFDQDISAVCGSFIINQKGEEIVSARIAFGGMSGIPKRALHVESALMGEKFNLETIHRCSNIWEKDFQPISDMRASSVYRLNCASKLLIRYFYDIKGIKTNVLEIVP